MDIFTFDISAYDVNNEINEIVHDAKAIAIYHSCTIEFYILKVRMRINANTDLEDLLAEYNKYKNEETKLGPRPSNRNSTAKRGSTRAIPMSKDVIKMKKNF